ncbi:MAG: response regulator, partial [Planctomycetaceae bacterium]
VVLMDVQMPQMDGLEATRRIRHGEVSTGDRVPIIAMTAQAMKGDRERCLAAGMDFYLSKPIRSRQVLDAIELLTRGTSTFTETNVAPVVSPDPPFPEFASPTSSDVARLDLATALAAVDGDEALLRDVAEAFVTEAPLLFRDAEAALERRDAPALKAAAHTLKGAISSFGDHPGIAFALAVEQAAKAGDVDAAMESFNRLREALPPLVADLSALASGALPPLPAGPLSPEFP